MRQLKFQRKLFLTYVSIVCVILLLFSLFFYHQISHQLIQKEQDSLTVLNDSFLTQTDSVIEDLDIVSANINYSSLMQNKLDDSYHLALNENTLPELAALFVTINGTDIKADQINLYDLTGNVAYVGMLTNVDTIDPSSLSWFDTVQSLGGKKLISIPYHTAIYSKSANYKEWFISVYRTYTNPYSTNIGAIETVKRCKNVFQAILSYEKKNRNENPASVYIFSSDGTLIYPYDVTNTEAATLKIYMQAYQKQDNDTGIFSFLNTVNHTKEHCAFHYSSYTDWVYITVQKESVILKPVNHLIFQLLCMVSILLFFALLYSYKTSKRLVRPLCHLKHLIQHMEINNLGDETDLKYDIPYYELKELYSAFQNMRNTLQISMQELLESRQQEYKATNLALQSQANPHFYFNTLSSIIVLAENQKCDDVISLCKALTKIMRYITDSTNSIVTLEQELNYVKQYLYCMKVRYQSSLNYSIHVDASLFALKLPKLIIQPLVENAIKYGTDCAPPWEINISGKSYPDHWEIVVTDSGTGFSAKVLENLYRNIAQADTLTGIPELQINGLGLMNVYLRWKFFVGKSMIFKIENTAENHGSCTLGAYHNLPANELT